MCPGIDGSFPYALFSRLLALHDDRYARRGIVGIRLTANLNIKNRVANSEDRDVP